jgi:hypothetical protein
MRVFALIEMNNPIAAVQLSVDGVVTVLPTSDRVNQQLNLTLGSHVVTVQATDNTNQTASSRFSVYIVPN